MSLLDLAVLMYDGESKSGLMCPFCEGGSTKEQTLFMLRDGRKVIYKCYRASCGKGGLLNLGTLAAGERKEELRKKEWVLEVRSDPLDAATEEYLKTRYFLSDQELRRSEIGTTTKYCQAATHRVYIPVLRYNRTIRGFVARDISGKENKKALSFMWNKDEPILAWYTNPSSNKLLIVEDPFSALRASSFVNSVALLGTDLSKAKTDEIVRNGFTEAWMALDKDATRQAVKLAVKLKDRLKLRVLVLDEDLKDLTRKELEEFFKEKELDGS
jgi:DNA primase